MQTSEPVGWRSLHWAMVLFEALNSLRSLVLPTLVFGATFQNRWFVFLWISMGLFLSITFVTLRYLSLRYQIGDGHIRIREGIFSKKIRSIPVQRIHNINTSQGPLARALNVMRLDIETAGGGSAEASLAALSFDAVSEIQDFVRDEKQHQKQGQDPSAPASALEQEETERRLYRITFKEIILAGATTNRMGLIMVGIGIASQYLFEYSGSNAPFWVQEILNRVASLREESLTNIILIGIATFLFMFLIAWLISIVTALVRWHNFTLTERNEDLNIRMGLLTLRNYTVPLNKIQAITCRVTAFRRPFSLVELRVRSAGHIGSQDQGQSVADVLAPISKISNIGPFITQIWADVRWDDLDWQKVHPFHWARQFRIMSFWLVLILAILTFAPTPVQLNPIFFVVVVMIGMPLCFTIAHLTYKQTAWALDGDFLYIKSGFLGLHFWIIPTSRIQNVAVWQTPFQRNRKLASLAVDVAGQETANDPVVPNIDVKLAWRLFNRLSHIDQLRGSPRSFVASSDAA